MLSELLAIRTISKAKQKKKEGRRLKPLCP